MSAEELVGPLTGALISLFAIFIPILTALLKLNTTLTRLAGLIEMIQKDTGRVEKTVEAHSQKLEAHETKISSIQYGLNRCAVCKELDE